MCDKSPPHYTIIEKYFAIIKNYKIAHLYLSTSNSVFVMCRTFPRKENQNTYCNSVVNIIIMAGHCVPCEPELHKGTLMQNTISFTALTERMRFPTT